MPTEKLLPCPFCGVNFKVRRNAITHPPYDVDKLGKRCGMDGIGWDNSEIVINMLNTRATTKREEKLQDYVEQLEHSLHFQKEVNKVNAKKED